MKYNSKKRKEITYMKNIKMFLIPIMLIAIMAMTAPAADAQLILVNLRVKIVKVERENNRLQARVHEKGNKNIQYIEIDGNTKFSKDNKPITFEEAWQIFKKDQIIRVKGGYTMSVHVKAKQIYM